MRAPILGMVYNSPRRVDNWALLILEDPTFFQNSVFFTKPEAQAARKAVAPAGVGRTAVKNEFPIYLLCGSLWILGQIQRHKYPRSDQHRPCQIGLGKTTLLSSKTERFSESISWNGKCLASQLGFLGKCCATAGLRRQLSTCDAANGETTRAAHQSRI